MWKYRSGLMSGWRNQDTALKLNPQKFSSRCSVVCFGFCFFFCIHTQMTLENAAPVVQWLQLSVILTASVSRGTAAERCNKPAKLKPHADWSLWICLNKWFPNLFLQRPLLQDFRHIQKPCHSYYILISLHKGNIALLLLYFLFPAGGTRPLLWEPLV